MKLFGQVIRTLVNVAALPVEVIKMSLPLGTLRAEIRRTRCSA